MTYKEALAVFGLTRIMGAAAMKVFYHDAARKARDAGDVEREKVIHHAWAVLIGKEEASLKDVSVEKVEGATGTARGMCTEKRGTFFAIDWKQVPRGAGESMDLLIYTNPQKIEWDGDVDGYVRVSAKGEKKPYDPMAALRKATDNPLDTSGKPSEDSRQKAKVEFEKAPCPVCQAPFIRVCWTCMTIICQNRRSHYPNEEFKCPKCSETYHFLKAGETSREPVVDGSQLRALMKEDRKEIADQSVAGHITYIGDKG
ncbi:MAG: hypothetical protein WC807_17165 [Hyphomicrobium sp.]|jgi:hypothetical protein